MNQLERERRLDDFYDRTNPLRDLQATTSSCAECGGRVLDEAGWWRRCVDHDVFLCKGCMDTHFQGEKHKAKTKSKEKE